MGSGIPQKHWRRDGDFRIDDLSDLVPVEEERDGVWLDFDARAWMNPKGAVLHLTKTCGHVNVGRCKELGVCLDCLDSLKKP